MKYSSISIVSKILSSKFNGIHKGRRSMRKIVFGIMLILLVVSTSPLIIDVKSVNAEENWWNSNWTYRKRITIIERSNHSLVDFPIEITFRHDGHVQGDGRDIRVIDNNVEVPYALTMLNSTHATITLEINLTALTSKDLFIYYGNPNALKPNYPLVPLVIFGGQKTGNATIDNRIFIGWEYVAWGVQPGWYIVGGQLVYIDNNPVVLWTDFRMDFDHDGVFEVDEDLITDIPSWKGGIGRYHYEQERFVGRSYGLGDFLGYKQTPVYVQLNFANAYLRIYRKQNFVETIQADRLGMEGTVWDYARFEDGVEQNIIDGKNTTGPPEDPMHNTIYKSKDNPGWMAFRDSYNGRIFGAIGLNINSTYSYLLHAKEAHAWDRVILFDCTDEQTADPHDQPPNCRIYWYADGTNNYLEIDRIASILINSPTILMQSEEVLPEFPSTIILTIFMLTTTVLAVLARHRMLKHRR
jgi:hypothetical protein